MTKDPIPDWCKKDCIFRDKKAKFMPACRYPFKLRVTEGKCLSYRKEQRL